MNFKRILAVVLVCVMCLAVLASCHNGPIENVRPDGSAGANIDTQFPAASYESEDFTFLVIKHSDAIKDYYGGAFIDTEGLNGGKVNDAVWTRNDTVEKKYVVTIKENAQTNSDPAVLLQQYIMSGDFTFDVVYAWGYKLGACITENYFADFNNLETADFTQEYWSPSTIEDLKIGDKLYLSQNLISMNVLDWASFLFYNKTLAQNIRIEEEEFGFGSPYDMVDNGTWTYDKFLAMVQAASQDTDGDGAVTRNDIFGLLDGNGLGVESLQNCGIYYTKETDDGYELTFMSEKTLNIIKQVEDVYSNSKYVKDFEDIWNEPGSDATGFADQWQYARSFFARDNALFCAGSANITSEEAFRNMESSYGVLPFPKYDQTQENYNANLDPNASLFALPSTVRTDMGTASFERTSHVLDYMAFKSQELLLPAYYEEVLKGQRMNDEADHRMLDIIRTNVHYELSSMVLADAAGNSPIKDTVTNMFRKPSMAASTYDRNVNKMENALDTFYDKVMALD